MPSGRVHQIPLDPQQFRLLWEAECLVIEYIDDTPDQPVFKDTVIFRERRLLDDDIYRFTGRALIKLVLTVEYPDEPPHAIRLTFGNDVDL